MSRQIELSKIHKLLVPAYWPKWRRTPKILELNRQLDRCTKAQLKNLREQIERQISQAKLFRAASQPRFGKPKFDQVQIDDLHPMRCPSRVATGYAQQ